MRIYACLLNEIIDKTNKYHIGDVILVLDQLKYNLPSAVQVLVVPVFSKKNLKKGYIGLYKIQHRTMAQIATKLFASINKHQTL